MIANYVITRAAARDIFGDNCSAVSSFFGRSPKGIGTGILRAIGVSKLRIRSAVRRGWNGKDHRPESAYGIETKNR